MSWLNGFDLLGSSELPRPPEIPPLVTIGPFSEIQLDYLRQIEGLHPECWIELSPLERLDSLQELEVRLAEVQGRPSVEIRVESLDVGQCGFFNRQQEVIVLSERILANDLPFDAIDTIAHEGRHAYQNYVVQHPEVHRDQTEVEIWRENLDNYLPAELYGYEIYRDQPIEADAWAYGESVRQVYQGRTT